MRQTAKCQVASHRACNGQVIRLYKGKLKNDPKFYACIGCAADLRRAGVKFSEVNQSVRK
jgi:hypothetical protein